ncbi:hypothetical protein HID58_078791 [Brassica napus]|uniref:BnaC07g51210D protein n=2 Tax=Brassica napus TaxID=3708 RepID=A0A078JL52_BRANA|nr:hypothetical protein HID58_078791 [Brassica napus]CAF2032685.1 unnamed protein product [Brassica napus]CDY66511.1 BnaC07g51210D [Brassica napus]
MYVDGNDGMNDGSCTHRNESPPLDTKSRSLVLQNYFITNPNATQACADNSSPLIKMMTTCHEAAGAAEAVDAANGRLTCGCDSLSLCKVYTTQLLVPKPAAGGESTRNPSDLPAGNVVTRATGLSSLVMISVATLLLWWYSKAVVMVIGYM